MDLTPAPLIQAAKAHVRGRLINRAAGDARSEEASQTRWNEPVAAVVEQIAKLIGVDSRCLRPEDHLGLALRVNQSDLPQNVQAAMPKFGLSGQVDPFAFDLLAFVEKRIAGDRSRLDHFHPIPRTEAEWIDRILGMTVSELATALS